MNKRMNDFAYMQSIQSIISHHLTLVGSSPLYYMHACGSIIMTAYKNKEATV